MTAVELIPAVLQGSPWAITVGVVWWALSQEKRAREREEVRQEKLDLFTSQLMDVIVASTEETVKFRTMLENALKQ